MGLFMMFPSKEMSLSSREIIALMLWKNVLFKISFPAEFHSQTAVEAAMTLHKKLNELGKTTADIRKDYNTYP